MKNNFIINYICEKYNIDISKYKPINEDGEYTNKDFDKKFELDRTYLLDFNKFKQRIRFVKYDDKEITFFKTTIKISNIIQHQLEKDGKNVYIKDNEKIIIPIKDVERIFKLNKIKNKMKL